LFFYCLPDLPAITAGIDYLPRGILKSRIVQCLHDLAVARRTLVQNLMQDFMRNRIPTDRSSL